ncbi:hypothetical protein MNV49_006326 [Pseudohyphozyma bogoriensis]|nr:hypothetical protein MNV49_006326 [Pseudohyphozyma bogoriensis]
MSLFDAADAKPNLRLSTIFSATTTTEQDELEASETTPKKRHATKASARPRRGNGVQRYRFSCEPCRKRKIRCTREEFCSSCVRRGKECACSYVQIISVPLIAPCSSLCFDGGPDSYRMVNEAAPTPRKVSTPSTHQQKKQLLLRVKLNLAKDEEEQATPTMMTTMPSTPPPSETPSLEVQPELVQQQLQPQVHLQSSETELETFYFHGPRHLSSLPTSLDPSHAAPQRTTSLNSAPIQPHYFTHSPASSFPSSTSFLSDPDRQSYHYQPACEQYLEQHDSRPLMDTSGHNLPSRDTAFSLYAQPELSFLNAHNQLSYTNFLPDRISHSNNFHADYAPHFHSPKHQHQHHAHDTLFDPLPFSPPSTGRELQPSPIINAGYLTSGSGTAWDGWGVARTLGAGGGHDTPLGWSSDGAQRMPSPEITW